MWVAAVLGVGSSPLFLVAAPELPGNPDIRLLEGIAWGEALPKPSMGMGFCLAGPLLLSLLARLALVGGAWLKPATGLGFCWAGLLVLLLLARLALVGGAWLKPATGLGFCWAGLLVLLLLARLDRAGGAWLKPAIRAGFFGGDPVLARLARAGGRLNEVVGPAVPGVLLPDLSVVEYSREHVPSTTSKHPSSET
jgi:hypothetical protein